MIDLGVIVIQQDQPGSFCTNRKLLANLFNSNKTYPNLETIVSETREFTRLRMEQAILESAG